MAGTGEPKSPVEQLVDLFVYAPVGFLYEREELLDKVVTRGRSQVQLARLMAKMASQRSGGPEAVVNDVANQAADLLTKSIVEFGVAVGLVPKASDPGRDRQRQDIVDVDVAAEDVAADGVAPDGAGESALEVTEIFPIDDYDTLNARTIIAMLGELELDEVRHVVEYEQDHRNRKTILAKADRLLS